MYGYLAYEPVPGPVSHEWTRNRVVLTVGGEVEDRPKDVG